MLKSEESAPVVGETEAPSFDEGAPSKVTESIPAKPKKSDLSMQTPVNPKGVAYFSAVANPKGAVSFGSAAKLAYKEYQQKLHNPYSRPPKPAPTKPAPAPASAGAPKAISGGKRRGRQFKPGEGVVMQCNPDPLLGNVGGADINF